MFEAGPEPTRPPAGSGSWTVRSGSRAMAIVSLVLGLVAAAAATFVTATAIVPIGLDPASCSLSLAGMMLPILLGSAVFPFALLAFVLGAMSVRDRPGFRVGSVVGILAGGLAVVVPLALVGYFWATC